MATISYYPGVGGTPFGNQNLNPQASPYAASSGYSPATSILIAKAIDDIIYDATPQQFMLLKLLWSKGFKNEMLDEFEYIEKTWDRSALESTGIVAAQPAVVGVPQTQVIPMTAASLEHLTLDLLIKYPTPGGETAIIRSISGLNVTVQSATSAGLPAVAAGDVFAVQATITADGQSIFQNYSRLKTLTRNNYVQGFLRAARWGEMELVKMKNKGTTNYLDEDRKVKLEQLRVDMFCSFVNGRQGEYQLASGTPTKGMGGIYPAMLDAGAAFANVTMAGFRNTFETLGVNTNYKQEGGVRLILGCQEVLGNIAEIYKDSQTRYTPSDKTVDLGLDEYKIKGARYVPVPCELFRDQASFPAEFARKIIVVDADSIQPIAMTGMPAMEMGEVSGIGNGTNYNYNTFQDFWVRAFMSLKFNNPLGGFWMNII